mgnify:FL=1
MTIGVGRKAVSFNKAICAKMGIGPDSKIAFLVDDRGFLAINVLDKESPTGIGLRRSSKKCGTLKLHSSALIRHIVPGRYRITIETTTEDGGIIRVAVTGRKLVHDIAIAVQDFYNNFSHD